MHIVQFELCMHLIRLIYVIHFTKRKPNNYLPRISHTKPLQEYSYTVPWNWKTNCFAYVDTNCHILWLSWMDILVLFLQKISETFSAYGYEVVQSSCDGSRMSCTALL